MYIVYINYEFTLVQPYSVNLIY